jgi:hypothetical protein
MMANRQNSMTCKIKHIHEQGERMPDLMLSEAILSELHKAAQTERTWREFTAKPLEFLRAAKLDVQDLKVTPSLLEFKPLKKPVVLKPTGLGVPLTHVCGYRWVTFNWQIKEYTFIDPLTHEWRYIWHTITTKIQLPVFCAN